MYCLYKSYISERVCGCCFKTSTIQHPAYPPLRTPENESRQHSRKEHVISTHLLLVLPSGRVQGLDQRRGVAHEHGVAGSTHNHAEDGQPHVCHAHWGVHAVANTQHVAHSFEKCVGVLLSPRVVLDEREEMR